MHPSRAIVLLAAWSAALSCGVDRPTDAALTAGQVWTVDSTPLRIIDESDGVAFDGIWGVDLLANGALLVVDTYAPGIWLFPSDGSHPIPVGRKGDGPGEYRRPQLLNVVAGGGFAIYDGSDRRVTVYGPDGDFRTAFPFLAAGRDSLNVLPARLLQGGAMLAVRHRWPRPTADGPISMPADVVLLDSTGAVQVSFGQFGYADWMSLVSAESPTIFPRWFGWRLVTGFSGQYVVAGENHTYEMTVFDLTGSPIGSIREEGPAQPVTPAQRDSILAMMQGQDDSAIMTRPETFSNTLPEFGSVFVDPAGPVWVVPYHAGRGAPDTVAIFTPEGARVATIVTPAGMRIGAIGDTTLIGIASDSNDVESVHVLRLRRGERAVQ